MNLSTFPDKASAEPGVIDLPIQIAIGATGAVGAVTYGRGLGTPVRNGAGDYTIPLLEGVIDILGVHLYVERTGTVAAANGASVTPYLRTPGGASPLVKFLTIRGDTGVAADPANGDSIVGFIRVKNTNA
jgi:hypothetical protein